MQEPPNLCSFDSMDGEGEILCCPLFNGVTVMLMRLEMQAFIEKRSKQNDLEINFCLTGRFETDFSNREHVLLKPGDMAVSCYDGAHGTESESRFPLGYYEGICLEVAPSLAQSWIEQNAPSFSVDFAMLKYNLLREKWYM